MGDFLFWAVFFFFFTVVPLICAIWFFYCLSAYNSTIPFTEERKRKKRWLIISGIMAGITVGTFLVVIFTYGITEFLDWV